MSFASIVGHHRLLALLARAIARETLPPVLLLAGRSGVGKRRTATAIALALNCTQPVTSAEFERDGCGQCPTCRRILRGAHPDVVVLEPGDSGAIKIDPVRDVIDSTRYRPFEARRRVVVIDEADALVPPAQNALLKTLEEPPSASIFLLVSSLPDALLATVRSRCPRLRFGTLTAREVADVLMRDHGLPEPEARALAADADGSVGGALAARGLDITEARAAAHRLLIDVGRLADPGRRLGVVKDLAGRAGGTSSASERDRLATCLRAASSLLRDLSVVGASAGSALLANADMEHDLAAMVPAWDGERTRRAYAAVDRALAALERNASPKVVADWLVLQL